MDSRGDKQSERSSVQPNADAVETATADHLEVQGGMSWIQLELAIAAIGKRLNVGGQRIETLPKALGRRMFQTSRGEPA